jgi:hypothetical protein
LVREAGGTVGLVLELLSSTELSGSELLSSMFGDSVSCCKAGLLNFIDGLVSHKHFFSGCNSSDEGTANVGMLESLFLSSGHLVVGVGSEASGASLVCGEQVGHVLV